MREMDYLDFDVLLERVGEGSYQARLINSPAGQARPVAFTIPFSAIELENFLLRLTRPRGAVRRIDTPATAAVKSFGDRLYKALFHDELLGGLLHSLSVAASQDAGLRIRLRMSDTPELGDLPWEFLYDESHNRFLALTKRTPLVRYLELPDPPRPLLVTPPLRILVMISSPSDLPSLDVEHEWANLEEALAPLQAVGRVQMERLESATLSALQRRLRRDDVHVFHFIGHGGFDTLAMEGVLMLADSSGRGRSVSGQDLGVPLHNHDPLRLVVLNACEGARNDRNDPFAGTAQGLIQQDIPAVVAMQFEITDAAAITFARELYGAVADGYPLDAAVAEARVAIHSDGNPVEWATPVLYLRAADGRIFDIASSQQQGPEFAVEPPRLDFPPATKGAPSLQGSLRIRHVGHGRLETTVSTTEPWLEIHQAGDTVTVTASTAEAGALNGTVMIRSGGSSVPVPITFTVEDPPRLAVEPAFIDFGTMQVHDPSPQRVVQITNTGSGTLEMRATTEDSWLHLEQRGDEVHATVDTTSSGNRVGTMTVDAGGAGTLRIPVTADVEEPPPLAVVPLGPPAPGPVRGPIPDPTPVADTTPVPTPTPVPGPTPTLNRSRARGLGIAAGVVVVAAVVIVLVARALTDGSGEETTSITSPQPTATTPTTSPPIVPLAWQQLPDLDVPLEAAGVATLGGKVWVVGGQSPDEGRPSLDTVWSYDPAAQNGWQPGPNLPVPLDSAGVASDGTRLFVVGGRTGTVDGTVDNKVVSQDVYVLDGPEDDDWELLATAELPEPRSGGGLAWDGRRLVFAGGYNKEGERAVAYADVWALDEGGQWKEIDQLAKAREDLAAATDGEGRVWFLGGNDFERREIGRQPLGAVDVVDGAGVQPLGDLATPVRSSAAIWRPDRGVCMFGGVVLAGDTVAETDHVVCLEQSADSPVLPPLLSPRAGIGATVLDDTIYLVGGFGPGEPGIRRVDALDLQ
jgi:CHAT domain/Kelch motif